jgi:hypothetical protein
MKSCKSNWMSSCTFLEKELEETRKADFIVHDAPCVIFIEFHIFPSINGHYIGKRM